MSLLDAVETLCRLKSMHNVFIQKSLRELVTKFWCSKWLDSMIGVINLEPPYSLRFPYLCGASERFAMAMYDAERIVYHLGSTTTSAHYRSALLREAEIALLTDDGRAAISAGSSCVSRVG